MEAKDLAEQVAGRDAKDSTVVDFMTPSDGVGLVDSTELDVEATIEAMLAEITRQQSARMTDSTTNHTTNPEGDRA